MLKKKVCMLGSFGVGKTSLVAQFVYSQYDEKYLTTLGVKVDKKSVEVDGQEVLLMVWDLAGEEEGAPIKLNQVRDADGYMLVMDGCRRKTLDVADDIQKRVEREIGPRPFLLLANKADQREKWEVPQSALEDYRVRGWTVLETSAKTGVHVEEAFRMLATRFKEDHGHNDLDEDD